MQIKWLGWALTSVAAAALVACGGSTPVVTLSGAVIDGYIEGATVCLDDNGDGACGNNEPQAVTGPGGQYTLATTTDIQGKYLVVSVPDSAKDSDDGGLTLAQAGKSAYVMATPAATPQVISPLTTLLVGKIKSDGLSASEARTQVLSELGLSADTDLQADHVASANAQVHAAARQLASRLQAAHGQAGDKPTDALRALGDALKAQQNEAGQLLSDSLLPLQNMPDSLAALADGKLLLYKMTSAKGQPITASAMLFTPKAPAPTGGRPLVVLGVGTTGIASQCAPSNIMQGGYGFAYAPWVAALLAQGLSVVVPDYEGRGPAGVVPDAHPYLHVGSAGQSMALAAVAAKRWLGDGLSGVWAAWGHSQGGHAALAAAQFAPLASRLESSLNYRGAVAVAPASHFVESVQGLVGLSSQAASPEEAFAYLGTLGFYASYIVKGTTFSPTPLNPNSFLGQNMRDVYAYAGSECINDYAERVDQAVTAYAIKGGLPNDFTAIDATQLASPYALSVLRSLEPGRVQLPGKTLLIQGSADTTVLPQTTQKLNQVMTAKGSDVTLTLVQDDAATHTGVLATAVAQQAMVTHLTQLFAAP